MATCVCSFVAAPYTWDLRYSELPNFTGVESGEWLWSNGKQNWKTSQRAHLPAFPN
jgi:hypothetical protein